VSGEFVAATEDIIELYAEADDPARPRVNFGVADARKKLPQVYPLRTPASDHESFSVHF